MTTGSTVFGPLAEPIHPDAAGPNDPPWRDNAYLTFWSDTEPVFGQVHVSTSPNADLRWARVALCVDGHQFEVSESVDPGSFASDSITFDVDGLVTVKSHDLVAELRHLPRFTAQDFSPRAALGGLVAESPLQHFEQGCDVTGFVEVDGRTVQLSGRGFRDRTWGFRDESKQWVEWLTVWTCFDSFDVTALKILGTDGDLVVAGFIADDAGQHRITDIKYTFDGAGRFLETELVLEDGATHTLSRTGTLGGLWLPVGPDRNAGPTLHSYNEFIDLAGSGGSGRALIGYGVLRRVH